MSRDNILILIAAIYSAIWLGVYTGELVSADVYVIFGPLAGVALIAYGVYLSLQSLSLIPYDEEKSKSTKE